MNKETGVGFTFSKLQLNCKGIKLIMALLVLISFSITTANAATTSSTSVNDVQQSKITGTVKSVTGEPLIGATVQIKGTTTGTVTDLNGNFSLNSANASVTLVVSYIGFEAIEVPATTSTPTEISLKELTTGLDEVVVIGYGVQKKKLVTGATVQVSGDDLQQQSTTNAIQALQGKTPGVQITSTSGQPGEGIKVTVRGLGTIGNGGPLYIVDGIVTDNISYLNNSDIESIDILKDAASAAIYGSRAANGVVLVTTKQGKSGKSQVTFDAYYGVQNTPKKFELCDAKQYAILMNEQYLNGGGNATALPFNVNKLSANTDWLGEMYTSNAVTQNYNLGITGGDDNSKYSMAVGYTGQEGIVGEPSMSNYDRYSGRFNSEHNLYKGILKVGQHLNYTFEKKHGIGVGNIYANNLRSAYNTSPLLPMYNADGTEYENSATKVINPTTNKEENKYLFTGQSNPYANMVYNNQSENNYQKIFGDIYAELKPFSGLSIRSTLAIDQRTTESRSFRPIYTLSMYNFSNETRITQYQSNNFKYTWSNYADYAFELSDHKFDFMVGTSFEKDHGVDINGANTNSSFYDFDHAYLSNALNKDASKITLEGKPYTDCILSYFGRFQYNYKETYMINGTMRADGSSNFASGNHWGYFPSISGGWVVSNEAFMESTQQFMDFLKLRASWGQNGNQAIDRFQYVAPIQFTNATYGFGSAEGASTQVNGSYPKRASSPKLKWETSEQYDFGFDARFLKSKLGVNFDIYQKSTKDWLLILPNQGIAGVDPSFGNGGNVVNKGVELGLTYNDNVGDFNYSVSGNGAINKNNVTEIPTLDGIIHGSTNSLYNNAPEFYRCQSGHSIGYFWGWKTAGIFQNQKEIDSYTKDGIKIQSTAKPGDVKYVDLNNDGKINDLDKTDLGSPLPSFTYGFNFKCDYKGFDFAIQTNGTIGNKVVQSYRDPGDQYANYSVDMYENRWHGEGTSNKYPRVTTSNINWQFSDLYVKDASFLRISNVTVGYNFSKWAKKNFVQQLRVYAAVQNLYTFTSYTGSDPEVGYGLDNGATDKFSSGIDLGYYPRPRTYLVGVNIIF